jgi:hypothetical protein
MSTPIDVVRSHWAAVIDDFTSRCRKPWSSPPFVFYFFVIVLLAGGLGTWISLYKLFQLDATATADTVKFAQSDIYRNLATYALAILASSFADMLLSQSNATAVAHRSLVIYSLGFLLLETFVVMFAHATTNSFHGFIVTIAGTLCALVLWWITNADNSRLLEPPVSQTAPTGGDPQQNPRGTLTGIRAN